MTTVTIPTTDQLDQAQLEELAAESQVPYEPVDGGGIAIECADDETAGFWRERGELWGRGRDFDDDQSAEDSDDPADQA